MARRGAQVVDVADPDAVASMVAETVAAFGGLDVLHNNAAALDQNQRDQDVVSMDLDTWHRVLDVNLTGPMLGCRFAIPAMLERGGGSIVNTASAAAFYGSQSLLAYGTSKAGLVALTRYVATAYGERGIRCNAVAPGVVVAREAQDALGGPMGARLRRYTTSHLIGRLGYPEEIAARGRLPRFRRGFVRHRRDPAGSTVGSPAIRRRTRPTGSSSAATVRGSRARRESARFASFRSSAM